MPPIPKRLGMAAAAVLALATTGSAAAAVNIVPTHTSSVEVTNLAGVLRAGSPWGPGSTASNTFAPIDGVFAPENQQWNNGSFWWDEDASVNPLGKVYWTVLFDAAYTLDRFVVQADDNDSYRLEWWDGATWQTAWDVAAVNTFGLVTRDSGVIGPITTDRLRFSSLTGDNYYALSELQAFSAAIPEPAVWAMLLMGFALVGTGLRSRHPALASRGVSRSR